MHLLLLLKHTQIHLNINLACTYINYCINLPKKVEPTGTRTWFKKIFFRQRLFCCWQQFTLRDYFAVSYLWLVNLNDVLNMWLLVVYDWSILKTNLKNFAPQVSIPHPVHSLAVYTTPYIYIPDLPLWCTLPFLSMPYPAEIWTRSHGISRPPHYPLHHSVTGVIVANTAI